MHFDLDGDGILSKTERTKMGEALNTESSSAITPDLSQGNVKAWFNGEPVPVVRLDRVPEYDGNGQWQCQYIAQLGLKQETVIHPRDEVRLEVESTEELNGKKILDWGQGSVSFLYVR